MASAFKDHGREVLVLTFKAHTAIDGNLFIAPKDPTTLDCVVGVADAMPFGVNRDDIGAGQTGSVVVMGTAFVLTSENLAAGNQVAVDTGGLAKVADASEIVVGVAIDNTNSGDYAEILLSL